MLFCHIQVAPFAHEMIRYMDICFPRNFITLAKHVVVTEAIKYLGKYRTISLILECEKEAIYTVNFLNIRKPKKFVVMTLKFELCGSAIEY